MRSPYTDMGFDDWRELASEDPQAFETARSAVIEEFLATVPDASIKRLRGLQWRIDTIRHCSSNPMAACIGIYNMMWEKLAGENGMLDAMTGLIHPETIYSPAPMESAQILAFRPRQPSPETPS